VKQIREDAIELGGDLPAAAYDMATGLGEEGICYLFLANSSVDLRHLETHCLIEGIDFDEDGRKMSCERVHMP
jgi:hypothetical protein